MRRKKIFILIFFFASCVAYSHAQNQSVLDSLLKVLPTAKADTNKFNLLIDIVKQYFNVNPEPILPYLQQAIALADSLNYEHGKVVGSNSMAIYYYLSNDLAKALQYAEQTVKKAEQRNQPKELFIAYNTMSSIYDAQGEFKLATPFRLKTLETAEKMKNETLMGTAYSNMGINLESTGKYTEALNYYLKALKIREAKNDSVGIANSRGTIGDVYNRLNDFDNARKYHMQSLAVSEKIGDTRDMIASYYRLGIIALQENKLEEAKMYEKKCLDYCKEINNLAMIPAAYQVLGKISDAEENYDESLDYHEKSLIIFEELGDKMGISGGSMYVGVAHMRKNNFNKALQYFEKARATADSTGFKVLLSSIYKNSAEAYAHKGDYKNAYAYSLLHNELGDSLLNADIVNKTSEMREKYEAEKKENEIALLSRDKELNAIEIKKQKVLKYSFIGGLALFSLLSVFVFNNFRVSNKLRLQKIRNRIADDLHDDIGSTLNSISVYSEVAKQKSPTVVHELDQIGIASRKIIDAMSDIVWTINTKNDSFEQIILRLRSLTFNLLRAKNIEHTFRADESLNQLKLSMEERRNFYLIFKEALNNLVKYADASEVSISLTLVNNYITLSIHDNGNGFDSKVTYPGNGLLSMKTRAEEMNAILTIDSAVGSGATIMLKWKA